MYDNLPAEYLSKSNLKIPLYNIIVSTYLYMLFLLIYIGVISVSNIIIIIIIKKIDKK